MNNMLNAVFTTWKSLFEGDNAPLGNSAFAAWVPTLMDILTTVLWVAMALVGAAGGIYAVYVGIKMARADSAEAREENKKRFINILVSIVVVIVLILVFNVFLPMIIGAFTAENSLDFKENINGQSVINTVRCLIGR